MTRHVPGWRAPERIAHGHSGGHQPEAPARDVTAPSLALRVGVRRHARPQSALALAALPFRLALLPAAADEPKKAADESDALFSSGEVLRLAIELGPKELDALRREPRKYVRATLKEGDKVVGREVGVHLKGAAGG